MAIALYHDDDGRTSETTFEVMSKAFGLADKLAQTEFVPAALRNRPAAIAAAMLVGHEVGLPPMTALSHINIIDGRPSMSAAIMRGLILARGHRIWVEEQTITRATICSQRRGEERVLSTTWTMDDAKRAGLDKKFNWLRYPRNMLVARATGDNARGNFMDVLGGIAYATEELEDGLLPAGELPAPSAPPAPGEAAAPPRRRKARAAATGAVLEDAQPPPGPEPEPIDDNPAPTPSAEAPPVPGEEEEVRGTPSPAEPPTEPAPEAAAGTAAVADTPVPEQPSSSFPGPVEGAEYVDPGTQIRYRFSSGNWYALTGPLADHGRTPAQPRDDAPPAGEPAPGETLSLAQQVAIACRDAGIPRAELIKAVTGKTSARELTRPEAVEVLETAKRIGRGEASLELREDSWIVLPNEPGEQTLPGVE